MEPGLKKRMQNVIKKLNQLPKEDPEALDWKNIFKPF